MLNKKTSVVGYNVISNQSNRSIDRVRFSLEECETNPELNSKLNNLIQDFLIKVKNMDIDLKVMMENKTEYTLFSHGSANQFLKRNEKLSLKNQIEAVRYQLQTFEAGNTSNKYIQEKIKTKRMNSN